MGQTVTVVFDTICCCCKEEPKKKKKKKKPDSNEKTSKRATITTSNWETISKDTSLTPSQIPDEWLTREVTAELPPRNDDNEFDFDKQVLEMEGYTVIIDRIIGKGGYGKVYKIKDKNGEILAAKVTELVKKSTNKTLFDTFKNEVFILRRSPYKNIIALKDHFICNQNLSFIIMEFATNGNLEEKLSENNAPFEEEVAKHYFVQISNAITYLHSKGIIHGDLKLPNVLLIKNNGKDVVKVTDFGCGRVVYRKDIGISMKSKAVGTVTYMSPEQIIVYIYANLKRGDLVKNMVRHYDLFKSDVWALGVCLYKFVEFHRPFHTLDKRNAEQMVEMLAEMKKGFLIKKSNYKTLSDDCIDLLKGLLEYDRFKRIDMEIVMTTKWVMQSDQYDPTLIKKIVR